MTLVRKTSGDRGLAPLVEASFADFKEAVEDGDTARSTSLVKALAELALIERGIDRGRKPARADGHCARPGCRWRAG